LRGCQQSVRAVRDRFASQFDGDADRREPLPPVVEHDVELLLTFGLRRQCRWPAGEIG
jgi:hypothetical protein